MDEHEEKAFSVVAIVLLLMIAFLDDGTTILALLAVAIPVIGQVTFLLDKLFALVAAVVINGWFIFRLRTFGRSGIANVAGGILEEASIPATTITTIIAIWMANHPQAAAVVGKVTAGVAATGALDTAEQKIAREAKTTAAGAVETEGGAKTAGETEAGGARKTGLEGRPSEVSTERKEEPGRPSETGTGEAPTEGAPEKPEVSKEALGEEPEPLEKLRGELLEKAPKPEEKRKGEEEESEEGEG